MALQSKIELLLLVGGLKVVEIKLSYPEVVSALFQTPTTTYLINLI
jgi:hypothetical protein